ncbi:MAG: HYR domain-containing protein [Bacteroidota bacterium]
MKDRFYQYFSSLSLVILIFLYWGIPLTSIAQISIETTSGLQLEATGGLELEVSGDWQNQGVFSPGLSTLSLEGDGNQNLLNTSGGFYNVIIDKSGGEVFLEGDISINAGLLSVINTDVNLNGYIITLNPTATLMETAGNTVKGSSGSITTTRDLNAPATVNVGGMGLKITTTSDLGSTQIVRRHTSQMVLGNPSIERSFEVIPTNNSSLNANLVFYYDESELNGVDESTLELFYSADGGATWVAVDGTLNTTDNSLTASNINEFGLWTLAGCDGSITAVCQDITVNLDANGSLSILPEDIDNGSTANCGLETLTLDVSSFSCDNTGDNTVTLTVEDDEGNSSSCSATVSVEDNEAPEFSICPPALQVNCNETLFYTIDASDNCAVGSITQTEGLPPNSVFPLGVTTNTYVATDAAGNSTSCTFTVTGVDNQAPVISCPAPITVDAQSGTCSAVVTFEDAAATDNCSTATISLTEGLASGSAFPVGTTTNTFTATDESGNNTSCSFTVTVSDTEVPVLTCPTDITVNTDAGLCSAVVNFEVSSSDNCNSSITQLSGLPSGSSFPLGTTTNIYLATDEAGNDVSCRFLVIVQDTEAPTAVCQDLTVTLDPSGIASITPEQADGGSSDNCGIVDLSLSQSTFTSTDAPVTMVTLTVTDAAGNTNICTAQVNIITLCDNPDANPVEICGNADFWSLNQGVQAPNRLLSAPNGVGARFYQLNDRIVVDLSNTIPVGETYTIHWKKRSNTGPQDARLRIYESEFGVAFNVNQTLVTNQTNGFTSMDVVAAEDTRYLLLENPGGGADFSVDAISYCTEDCVVDPPVPYCGPVGNNTEFEWIERVVFESIDNTSGNDYGYGNYTNLSTEVDAGSNYSIDFYPGFSGDPYDEFWSVFVDWNQDGDFNDPGELSLDLFGQEVSGVVNVPSSAATGSTVMRVLLRYDQWPNPCDTYFEGEVEDYTLQVAPCVPSGNTEYEWIERVQFAGIDNTSGDDGGYGDYQSISTTLNQGGIYPITLTPGYAGAAFNEFWRVFIDWNQDGQLNPQTELAAFGYGSGPLSGNIQVPGTASLGSTLMRVVVSYDGWPATCATGFAGETEDYTVIIGGSSALQAELPDFDIATAAQAEMGVYPNPTKGQVQIDLSGIATESGNLIIRDVNGQIVYQQIVDRWEQTRFDLNLKEQDLPAGSYFIQYQSAENLYTKKLILTD